MLSRRRRLQTSALWSTQPQRPRRSTCAGQNEPRRLLEPGLVRTGDLRWREAVGPHDRPPTVGSASCQWPCWWRRPPRHRRPRLVRS